jgi:DNA polymerase
MQFQSIEGDSVEKIFDEIRNFNECILKKSANNTVCGDGNMINPDVVLIGEAPGEEEDLAGVPFCGKSGKLLEKALSLIGLNRKLNLFITNSVFWRPPNNRKPTTNEINLCKPFVLRMISVLQPKLVILCGSTAHSVIFNNDDKMSDLVGKMIDLNNIKFTTVYHPSYLIRNPIAKKNMWDNLLVIKNYLSH